MFWLWVCIGVLLVTGCSVATVDYYADKDKTTIKCTGQCDKLDYKSDIKNEYKE